MRSQPLIAVRDVFASVAWYEAVLGAERLGPPSDHGHIYQRLMDGDRLVMQLHCWDEEDHPNLVDADKAPVGHGVLLWFEVDDFEARVAAIRALGAEVVEDVHVNPPPNHYEIWLRDPDGYTVVICSPDGSAA